MRLKLIILDFDGPVNNLAEAKILTIRKLAKRLGVKLPNRTAWDLINYIDQIYENERIVEYRRILKIAFSKLKSQILVEATEEQLEKFYLDFEKELLKNLHVDSELIEFIKNQKDTNPLLKVCIYSSQNRSNINLLLNKANIKDTFFDRIYDRDSFTESKPSIVNLDRICKDFNVKPSEVVMVGDNVVMDLAPAKYLGMKTVLLTRLVDYLSKSTGDLATILE